MTLRLNEALHLASALFAGACVALAAVFAYLYGRQRRTYLGLYAVVFAALSMSFLASLVELVRQGHPEALGSPLGFVAAAFLTLLAVEDLTGSPLSSLWRWLAAASAALLLVSLPFPALLPSATARSLVAHLFVVPVGLAVGLRLWRQGGVHGVEFRVAGVFTALAQGHSGLHPFIPWLGWYAPVGWVVEAGLTALMGAAVLMAHLQRMRSDFDESERRFAGFFEASLDPVLLVSFHGERFGEVLEGNDAAAWLLGRGEDDLRGVELRSLVSPRSHAVIDEGEARLAATGEATFEVEVLTASGTTVPVETANRVVVMDGRPAVVSVSRDLTARLQAEDERRALQVRLEDRRRLEVLALVAGAVAHELRVQVSTMADATAAAATRVQGGTTAAADVERLRRATERSSDLVRQLLSAAGRGDYRLEVVPAEPLVRETLHLAEVAGVLHAPATITAPRGDLRMVADEGRLREALVELLRNAAEASAEGGVVAVDLDRVELDAARLAELTLGGETRPGAFVRIRVSDRGEGMDEETLSRAVEPFFTRRALGRGLGLSSVLGVVRCHRGAMTLSSRVGEGTTVTVLVPAAD